MFGLRRYEIGDTVGCLIDVHEQYMSKKVAFPLFDKRLLLIARHTDVFSFSSIPDCYISIY